jgi:hypothetical protein
MLRPPLLLDDAGTVAELTEVQQMKAEDESSTSSCLCLGRRNTVRVLANKITESAASTKTVMIVIILNCVLVTTADYRPERLGRRRGDHGCFAWSALLLADALRLPADQRSTKKQNSDGRDAVQVAVQQRVLDLDSPSGEREKTPAAEALHLGQREAMAKAQVHQWEVLAAGRAL